MANIIAISLFVFAALFLKVQSTALIDWTDYYLKITKETFNELERRGWDQFKAKDITQNIVLFRAGQQVNGTVLYKNGFMRSVGKIDIVKSTAQEFWYSAGDKVELYAVVNLRDVDLAFDVEYSTSDGDIKFYTGIYTYFNIAYRYMIATDIPSLNQSATTLMSTVQPGTRRIMVILPNDLTTQIISSQFIPGEVWDSVDEWRSIITEVTEEVLKKNKDSFPDICVQCNV